MLGNYKANTLPCALRWDWICHRWPPRTCAFSILCVSTKSLITLLSDRGIFVVLQCLLNFGNNLLIVCFDSCSYQRSTTAISVGNSHIFYALLLIVTLCSISILKFSFVFCFFCSCTYLLCSFGSCTDGNCDEVWRDVWDFFEPWRDHHTWSSPCASHAAAEQKGCNLHVLLLMEHGLVHGSWLFKFLCLWWRTNELKMPLLLTLLWVDASFVFRRPFNFIILFYDLSVFLGAVGWLISY